MFFLVQTRLNNCDTLMLQSCVMVGHLLLVKVRLASEGLACLVSKKKKKFEKPLLFLKLSCQKNIQRRRNSYLAEKSLWLAHT